MNKEAEIPQDISGDQIGNIAIGWDIKDYRITEVGLQVLKESNWSHPFKGNKALWTW